MTPEQPVVLVVTTPMDPCAEAVCAALKARGIGHERLDPGDVPQWAAVEARFGFSWTGELRICGRSTALEDVRGVYHRVAIPWSRMAPAPAARFATAHHRAVVDGLLSALECRWLNAPAALAADTRLRQLSVAFDAGFEVPRAMLSTLPAPVAAFHKETGGLMAKPLIRPAIDELHLAAYQHAVSAAQLEQGRPNGYFFQELLPREYVVRLVAVGGELFGVSFFEDTTDVVDQIPDDIATAARTYLARAGLGLTVLHFVVTPSGRWVFTASDASADWTWYADQFGFPIADTIVDILTEANP